MRVLVADDEPLARRGIIKRLTAHADIKIIGEAEDGESALSHILTDTPDMVFLDVHMPGMDGLEVLRLLSPRQRPLTVFLTAYDHYALQAFEVHALDYLLKPIDDDRFAQALDRARGAFAVRGRSRHKERLAALLATRAGTPYATRFAARTGHRVVLIATADIDWIEAMGDYAGLHVGTKVHLLREPLYRLVRRLDPAAFTRIHRSTIVRMDRIAEIRTLSNRDLLLRLHDDTQLRASRTYVSALLSALTSQAKSSN